MSNNNTALQSFDKLRTEGLFIKPAGRQAGMAADPVLMTIGVLSRPDSYRDGAVPWSAAAD